jgi:hypothetical protein
MTSDLTTSRHQLLGALAGTPALVGIMALGVPEAAMAERGADAELFRLFAIRQENLARTYDGTFDAIEDAEEQDRQHSACCDRAAEAAVAMAELGAKTPAGVILLLLAALPYIDEDRWLDEALSLGRHEEVLAQPENVTFPARLAISAIRSLQKMEG